MRVLIACEESQVVCKAFREKGHEAYSCDIQECSGGHPEWHIKCDVRNLLDNSWDVIIGHPPCKFLAWSGERWMKDDPDRQFERQQAFVLFKELYNANAKIGVCIENSLSYFLERTFRKPTQKVHPFHFGDPYHKTTCFWLRGLKPLIPTSNMYHGEHAVHNMWPCKDRDKLRAKTYPGIAAAMAQQWG